MWNCTYLTQDICFPLCWPIIICSLCGFSPLICIIEPLVCLFFSFHKVHTLMLSLAMSDPQHQEFQLKHMSISMYNAAYTKYTRCPFHGNSSIFALVIERAWTKFMSYIFKYMCSLASKILLMDLINLAF